jgi:hypothetical protein
MISFTKPGLRDDLYTMQSEEVLISCCMFGTYTFQRSRLFIIDKPILSSERVSHRDYGREGSVAKMEIAGRELEGAFFQDELIDFKSPVEIISDPFS